MTLASIVDRLRHASTSTMSIWTQPNIEFVCTGNLHQAPSNIEHLVPGAFAWASTTNAYPRTRLHELDPNDITQLRIWTPLNCAYLVRRILEFRHIGYRTQSRTETDYHPLDAYDHKLVEAQGRDAIAAMIRYGEVRPTIFGKPTQDAVTSYQAASVSYAMGRPWMMNVWATGSGKTIGAALQAFTRPGPVLVLTPAKARRSWRDDMQRLTTLEVYRVLPEGERKKGTPDLETYLGACRAQGVRPVVVVGSEALRLYTDVVELVNPQVLIVDEVHMFGNPKRWSVVQKPDGTPDFRHRTTKKGNLSLTVAAMQVAQHDSIDLRIGLSATPFDDGRPRRLWSQLDMLWPGGFSCSYRRFALRYCSARLNDYGGIDDKGSSNLDELKARTSFFLHEVPYSVSHGELPPTRVQVIRIDANDLSRAARYSDDETYGQAEKALAKRIAQAGRDPKLRRMLTELRLAAGCSRKRRYVTEEAVEGLQGGGKVVVFTARRAETEIWANDIKKKASQGDRQLAANVWIIHGGVPDGERDRILDAFRDAEDACCLVATGQSVGVGVDGLQTANLAIFAMLPWRPGDFVQWKGRFDRLGGTATLLKIVVAKGTYDETVVQTLVDKFGPVESFFEAEELQGVADKLTGMDDYEGVVNDLVARLFGGL